MTKRLEFSTATKLEACIRRLTCSGLVELRLTCNRPLTDGVQFDHIKRCEIEPDNSVDNCRPLCLTCHAIKTAMDAKQAAKGRRLRGENKPKQKRNWPSGKIQSRGFPSKEERRAVKEKMRVR